MAEVPVTVTKPDRTKLTAGWIVTASKDGAPPIEATPSSASLRLTGDGDYTVEVSTAPDGLKTPPTQTVTVTSDKAKPATVVLALELSPVTVAVRVLGPDDNRTVDKWEVEVTGPNNFKEAKSADDLEVVLSAPGDYKFTLKTVGSKHVLPDEEYRSKVVKVSGADNLVANIDGMLVGKDMPVTWYVSADHDTTATGLLVTVEAALMALIAVGFWTFVITLDPDTDGLGRPLLLAMGVIGLFLVALALVRFLKDPQPGWTPVTGTIGILMLIAAFGLKGQISLTEEHQFAIATGGVAIAAFVIGLLRFDTVKSAASLPIVVLFIGLAAWPSGAENMDPDVQETLIIAMGGILGISAIGEAVQQATNNSANARVKAAEAEAAGATNSPAASDVGVGKSVSRPSGDMARNDPR